MKKVFVSIVVVMMMMVLGFSTFAKSIPPNIQINGVNVYSDANYVDDDHVMVDVEAFFKVLNQDFSINNNRIVTKGKSFPVKVSKGKLVADLQLLAKLVGAEKVTYFQKDKLYYVLALPEGVIQHTQAVPKMGEHWARPQDMPLGPIYGVYQGKLVFIEQMPSQEFFVKGNSLVNLDGMRGLPSPSINHTNIEFQAHGHEGYLVPHYDIHHYFISPEEQDAIK